MIKNCIICGAAFEAAAANAKYCSQACAAAGAKKARLDWIQATGYNEKRREKAAAERAAAAEAAAEQKKREAKRAKANATRARNKANKAAREVLEAEARAGSIPAKMEIALEDGNGEEYWNLRQQYYFNEAERNGHELPFGSCTVAGIDITDPEFSAKVIAEYNNPTEGPQAAEQTEEE